MSTIHPTAKKLLRYQRILLFIDDKLPNKEFLEDLKRFKKELVADGLGSLIPWLRSLADLETVKERRGAFNQFLKNPPDLSRRKFSKAVAAGFLGLTWLGRKANEEEAPKPTTKNIPRAIKQKAIPTTLSLAYNLHSILNNTPRVKLVRQPIFSRLDNAPIIIIIEDVHDMFNPKENWIGDASQIMAIKFILEMELGIRDWVVGLEGWVGEKVEKERGYKVNRNEKHPVWDLLAALKSKGNIPVIGIEDTYYHEQAIKFFAVKCDDGAIQWGYIEKIKSLPAGYADEQIRDEKERCRGILAEINLTFNQQTIDKARAEFDSLLSAHGLISKDKQEDFVSKELEKEKIRFFEEADEEAEMETYRFPGLHPEMDSQEKDKQLKLLESSIKGKAKERWLKVEQVLKEYLPKKYLKDRRTNAPVEITCFLAERSQKSAEILVRHMKNKNLSAGVMFYGNRHTPSLIEALQKLGDFSIFVVK